MRAQRPHFGCARASASDSVQHDYPPLETTVTSAVGIDAQPPQLGGLGRRPQRSSGEAPHSSPWNSDGQCSPSGEAAFLQGGEHTDTIPLSSTAKEARAKDQPVHCAACCCFAVAAVSSAPRTSPGRLHRASGPFAWESIRVVAMPKSN